MVEALERSPRDLQEAHAAYDAARSAERELASERAAKYEKAAQLLERGGSPLSLLARIGYINAAAHDPKPDAYARATALLAPIERDAKTRGYQHLLARIHATAAYFLTFQSRFVESLAQSQDALAEYERDGDLEALSDTHMRQDRRLAKSWSQRTFMARSNEGVADRVTSSRDARPQYSLWRTCTTPPRRLIAKIPHCFTRTQRPADSTSNSRYTSGTNRCHRRTLRTAFICFTITRHNRAATESTRNGCCRPE